MNGDTEIPTTTDRKGEVAVILTVTFTICLLALICVGTQALCVIYKIPDMNTTLSNAFMHVADTIVGALIGWCAKTGAQKILKKDEPDKPELVTPEKTI